MALGMVSHSAVLSYRIMMNQALREIYQNQAAIESVLRGAAAAPMPLQDKKTRAILTHGFTHPLFGEPYFLTLYAYLFSLNNGVVATRYGGGYDPQIIINALEENLYYSYLLTFQTQLILNNLALTNATDRDQLHRWISRDPRLSVNQLKVQLAGATRFADYRTLSWGEKLARWIEIFREGRVNDHRVTEQISRLTGARRVD